MIMLRGPRDCVTTKFFSTSHAHLDCVTGSVTMASIGKPKSKPRVLIIVENLPVPFDRRVWSEATALHAAGYGVSIICPKGKDATAAYEAIDGIAIHRHPLPT